MMAMGPRQDGHGWPVCQHVVCGVWCGMGWCGVSRVRWNGAVVRWGGAGWGGAGGVMGGEERVGGFLFGTAWRSRNLCGDNFFSGFSRRLFLMETCAESNFFSCFSPGNGGRMGQFAHVSAGNVCELALWASRVAIFAQVSTGNVCEKALWARLARRETF